MDMALIFIVGLIIGAALAFGFTAWVFSGTGGIRLPW